MKSLVVLFVLLCSATCVCAQSNTQRIRQQRVALEQKFEELCGQEFDHFRRGSHQTLFYLKQHRFDPQGNEKHAKYATLLGDKLLALSKVALAHDDATLAYDLLHESNFFHNETAAKIIGQETQVAKAIRASSTHSHLRWKRKTYFLVTTEHFQIATKDEAEGIALANRLEQLHTVWSQLFFTHWSDHRRLAKSLEQNSLLVPRTKTRRHKVVLFPNRDAYIEFLTPRQPRIEITLGFYDIATRTSYFFAGDDASESTQLHEVTHQLFQELTKTSRRETFADNFWAIEGVAMYLESMFVVEPVAVVGGIHANRLQYARFRRLQEGFYVPAGELSSLSRNQLQRDNRIRKIYSQAAGLTHFLLNGEGGSMRQDYVAFLRQVYAGKADAKTLVKRFPDVDQGYADYLRVDADDFAAAWIADDVVKSLCLGGMSIDDRVLEGLGRQAKLEWLDLARTRISEEGLTHLNRTRSLRQLSLDGTSISDESVAWIASNQSLEELDLSNTSISGAGVQQLAKLSNLETLWLSNTKVGDEIVAVLSQMDSLGFVALDGTRVTDEGRKRLQSEQTTLRIQ